MHENSLCILLPVSMAVSASEQIFATVTDLHSHLVVMQIVVHHTWKTDASFPSVNSAERNPNGCTVPGWRSYIRLTGSRTQTERI